jgi:PIN domain nuclease of toxin-antitoxin system
VNPSRGDRPVFDASVVLALMQGEPGAEKLKLVQPEAVVNAVNAAEVLAKLVSRGMPAEEAQAAYDALHLETASFDQDLVLTSARYVRKGVSLGGRCFFWRRLIGTGEDGPQIANSGRCSEAAFRL